MKKFVTSIPQFNYTGPLISYLLSMKDCVSELKKETYYLHKNSNSLTHATNGWLPAGFRNLNNISKSFNCHQPRSRLPNGSYFEVSCHCLSIRPTSTFWIKKGHASPPSSFKSKYKHIFSHVFHCPTLVGSCRWDAVKLGLRWCAIVSFIIQVVTDHQQGLGQRAALLM